MLPTPPSFDDETWQQLPDFLEKLPQPVCLHIWADENATEAEREAVGLAQTLNSRFPQISYRVFLRRENYHYYPVIGVMAGTAEESTDYGLRIIGLPIGYQMTSLIAAMQAAAFQGQTLEPLTRIKLHRMTPKDKPLVIELLTSGEDTIGSLAAKYIFGAAVVYERIRALLIVTDFFPEVALRYSVATLPHMVINRRVHFNGEISEEIMLDEIAKALSSPD